MSHPVLETLFFLKTARQSVVNSINESEVEDSAELINYVTNEASDYEIMHLIAVGEMPEEKYNTQLEGVVWDIFKEAVIMNTESLKEDVLRKDIMTIVYEMGPVSQLGYSSAAPILEFAKENGQLTESFIQERIDTKDLTPTLNNKDDRSKPSNAPEVKLNAQGQAKKFYGDNKDAIGKAGGAAVAAVGLFGLYKMYKLYKNKVNAAKTAEAKAAATAELAKIQAKIKAKKKA